MRTATRLDAIVEEGMRQHRLGERVAAERAYREALSVDPTHVVGLHLLGAVLLESDRDEEAADVLGGAVVRWPDNAVLLANLGEAYRRLGYHDLALGVLDRALALKPGLAEAHCTRGATLLAGQRSDEACACFERALSLQGRCVPAAIGLAQAHHAAGRLDEARSACARALDMVPQDAEAHYLLGIVLRDLGRIDDAISTLRMALRLRPGYREAHSRLIYTLMHHPAEDGSSIAREAAKWQASLPIRTGGPRWRSDVDRRVDRRLRVGFVSPDFRRHAIAHFLVPLLEGHDPTRLEVCCYASVRRPDAITERVRRGADVFRDILRMDDAAAADAIAADRVDILFDLAMHTGGNRLALFAYEPAPVQATWLAYPGTTGLDTISYRITDSFLDPPGADTAGEYSETSVHLPDSIWCFDPIEPGPGVAPLPALRSGVVTFGSLNAFAKTNAGVLGLWARVLRAVEGSRLLLHAQPGAAEATARDALEREGIDSGRVDFMAYAPRAEYLATYDRIDVGLDTFPYGGGTTSLDAFWMGVPVVTLVGRTAAGRGGLSIARNLGLDDLATTTPEQYVEVAARLTRDLDALARLRPQLRDRLERSSLMDRPRFARSFESACRSMWTQFATGEGP
jgi:protein O-GlcNAc transferase